MSGTYRHGRVYCQMADCRERTTRLVKVELPASWSDSSEYTTRTLLVGVCGACGRDLDSRARGLIAARAEFARLLAALDEVSTREAEARVKLNQAVDLIAARVRLRRGESLPQVLRQLDRPVGPPDGRVLPLGARATAAARRGAAVGRPSGQPDRDPGAPAA